MAHVQNELAPDPTGPASLPRSPGAYAPAGYFRIEATRGASPTLERLVGVADETPVLLSPQPGGCPAPPAEIEGRRPRPVAFPDGLIVLGEVLLCGAPPTPGSSSHVVYAPVAPFERLARRQTGAPVIGLGLRSDRVERDAVLEGLIACLRRPDAGGERFLAEITTATLVHLTAEYGVQARSTREGGLAPWQLRIAREMMEQHRLEGVAVQTLAQECGVSLSHFSRAFKRSTGLAPHQWIARRRVQDAMRMIRGEDRTLLQVASACGFFDHSHLVRAFRRWAGCSPSVWRQSQVRAP